MGSRPKSILVVDDNPEVREVLRDLLEMEGFSVTTAEGGLSALLQIGRSRPGCVVLDLRLDGPSGFEVHRALRADPEFQDLPVLFISGAYADEAAVRRQLDEVPVHYLPKPLVHEELVRVVRSLMEPA